MIKKLVIVLFTLTLFACGGGGGGGDSKNKPAPQPSNNAPAIGLFQTSLSVEEVTEHSVTITASDADGDTLTLSAESSNTAVTVSITDNTLNITIDNVDADTSATVTVTASDGKANKNANLTISITDRQPVITVESEEIDLKEMETVRVPFESEFVDDNDSLTARTVSDDKLAVSIDGNELVIENIADIGESTLYTTSAFIEVTSGDELVSQELKVTITKNQVPSITLAGVDEHNVVEIFTGEEVTIPVILNDGDGDEVTWGLAEEFRSSFEEDDNNPLHGIKSYHFDTENDVIKLELDYARMGRIFQYNAFLWVSDGTETVRTDFYIRGKNRPNGAPVLKFDERVVGGRVPVDIGGTTVVSYEIIDDKPEAIEFGEFIIDSGDASIFTLAHDINAQTITITHNGTENGEELYFGLPFTDVDSNGVFYLTAKSRPAWGEWQESMMAYVLEGRQKLAAGKEYAYIAEFYADVLENKGVITGLQAEEYRKRALVNDSKDLDLFVLLRSLNVIEEYVTLGEWMEGDEVATVGTVEYRFETVFQHYGKQAQLVIEELVAKSENQLISLPFIDSVHEYDVGNSYFSHFTSDAIYGSTINGKWVFKDEYSFLQAIVEKTRSEITNSFVEE